MCDSDDNDSVTAHRITASEESVVMQQLQELKSRELIREMEKGGFVRQVLEEKTGHTGIFCVFVCACVCACACVRACVFACYQSNPNK